MMNAKILWVSNCTQALKKLNYPPCPLAVWERRMVTIAKNSSSVGVVFFFFTGLVYLTFTNGLLANLLAPMF